VSDPETARNLGGARLSVRQQGDDSVFDIGPERAVGAHSLGQRLLAIADQNLAQIRVGAYHRQIGDARREYDLVLIGAKLYVVAEIFREFRTAALAKMDQRMRVGIRCMPVSWREIRISAVRRNSI
jgi:hypothetical protein